MKEIIPKLLKKYSESQIYIFQKIYFILKIVYNTE